METPIASRAQIALALILLKSAPLDLSLDDHIEHIRSSIVHRARKKPMNNRDHVDGTLFWKNAFERSESANDKLRDRIFDLEEKLEEKNFSPTKSPVVVPKRASARIITQANMQTKRRKVEVGATEEQLEKSVLKCSVQMPSGSAPLLRAYHTIRIHLGNDRVDASALGQSVKATSFVATKSLEAVCNGSDHHSNISSRITVQDVCKMNLKLWTCLLEAATRLHTLDPNAHAACVPSIASLLRGMLIQIRQSCQQEASKQITSKRRQTKAQRTVVPDAEPGPSVMAESMCHMLGMLDLRCEAHCSIFEVSVCDILDHIGSSISLLVFTEADIPIEKQLGVLPPTGLKDVSQTDSSTALLASEIAGPYLVPILKKSIEIIDSLGEGQHDLLLGSRTALTKRDGSLLDKLKQRLQNTLLRSIYGDEDATFNDALKRAEAVEKLDMKPVLQSMDISLDKSEWFIGQVWECLGWDILLAR